MAGGRRRDRGGAGPPRIAGMLPFLLVGLLALPVGAATVSHPSSGGATVPNIGLGVDPPTDWSTFHGGENRSGYSPVDGPIGAELLWTRCFSQQPIRVGPVANATRVFVADNLAHLAALDRNDNGSLRWSVDLGTTPTTADLSGGYLVVGGSDGYVTALNASTGSTTWSTFVGAAVAQGVSIDRSTVFVTTTGGTVDALDLATGGSRWVRSLDGPAAGAPALSQAVLYAASYNGTLFAFNENGTVLWTQGVGATVDSAPAVADGFVLVADRHANVTAFSDLDGHKVWRWSGPAPAGADGIESTPAVSPTSVYVQTDLGTIAAINVSTGATRWLKSVPYTGYPTIASPAVASNAVYFADSDEELIALAPSNGRTLWSSQLNLAAIFSSPALDRGALFIGDDVGCVFAFGRPGGEVLYPVSGTVEDTSGSPLAGALVFGGFNQTTSGPDGRFTLGLPNGTLSLAVSLSGYVPAELSIVVAGPLSGLTVTLGAVVVFEVRGLVRDQLSGHGIGGVSVLIEGVYGYAATTTTSANGSFALGAPNGSDYLSLGPPGGYEGLAERFDVNGTTVSLLLVLAPVGTSIPSSDSARWDVLLPLVALSAGAAALGFWEARRRRIEAGMPTEVIGRFGRFIVARILLIPAQLVAILSLLYIFGTFLPALSRSKCASGDLSCVAQSFGGGYRIFLVNLFSGSWGTVTFGALREPATLFLNWWFPDSLELAAFALLISALIAYPLGLLSGWHPESYLDAGIRLTSLVGLLLPTFLLALLVLGSFYNSFTGAIGDAPFGLLPTPLWYGAHGGEPSWIGIGSNTSPTGLPLVDGLLHGDFAFEEVVLAKTLLQSLLIATVYVAIFLRYARTAVAEAAGEPHLIAARARGVVEGVLLWRHTGRRVLPLYLLVFGVTLPVYLGTQAVVEALFNDTGVGTLLIAEMTHFANTGFGFGATAQGGQYPGNFYQVTIFLLVLAVLIGNLFVDIVARYLDPRDAGRGRP